jgi:hypothetical protein
VTAITPFKEMAPMRTFFTFIASLIALSILAGIGLGIYNAGVAQGIVEAGRIPAGAAVPIGYGYGYGWGGGFGFLGLLFPIFFVFVIFAIIRGVSGHGRRWGRGWDGGPGGYRGGYGEGREHWVADMHRRLHESDAGEGANPTGSTGETRSSGSGSGPSTAGR